MARARVRFSASGSGKVTGAFGRVGRAASGASGKVGKAGAGIGGVFFKIFRQVGRFTMLTHGLQTIGKGFTGAQNKAKAFSDGTVTAVSAVSKKFAELRRTYHFFGLAAQKIAEPFKWALGVKKGKAPQAEPEEKPSRWLDRSGVSAQASAVKVAAATTVWQKFLGALSKGGGVISGIARKIFTLKNILAVLAISFTAMAVAGGAAFVYIGIKTAKFARRMAVDFMQIREVFRRYEISLGGIIKNTFALGKIMKFATRYASEYPAMFEEVLDTFRSLAALPALKPMFRRADEQDLKKVMNIIQGLATLDPIQGVKGAGIALREALSGDMRSIRRRFEISAHAIAEAGGYAMEEITQDSEKALKAFDAFIKLNVPAKSMADAAMTIAIQTGNLRDKYRAFVNDIMKSTGAYWSVVGALKGLNEWLQKVFDSPVIKKWATDAGKHIRAFVDTFKVVLSGVNWGKYIESGDLLGGFIESAQKIAVFLKTMAEKWSKPFLDFVSKVSKILWKGLIPIVGIVVKAIWILFVDGMKAAGIAAGKAFVKGLVGAMAMRPLDIDAAKELSKKIDPSHVFKGGEKVELDIDFETGKTEKKLKGLGAQILDIYKKEFAKDKPEIVTPELSMEEREWRVKDLKEQLAASEKIGASKQRQLAITNALAEAEKELSRAVSLTKWEAGEAKGRGEAQKQMEEYEAAILKARKAGENLGADFYEQKAVLQEILDKYTEMYSKLVDHKSAAADLVSMIQAAPDSLKNWVEQYKIGKKDAGGLLLVVKKLNDIISGKVTVKREAFLGLLKKRIELTDANIKKEKDYQKQIASTSKSIAQNLVQLASGLHSSILSFVDKLGGAFIGVGKYGGAEPEPEIFAGAVRGRKAKKAARKEAQDRAEKERISATKEARESVFRKKVMLKIGTELMVPENVLGLGRAGLTYGRGMGTGEGKEIPPYIDYMLKGIKEAVITKEGPAEFPGGRKALAEMRMGLLEKAVPFTPYRSEERAELYAKMAGAQTDLMKATIASAAEEAKLQKEQLIAVQETAKHTKEALDRADAIRIAIENIVIKGVSALPQQFPAKTNNNNLSEMNPSTSPAMAY